MSAIHAHLPALSWRNSRRRGDDGLTSAERHRHAQKYDKGAGAKARKPEMEDLKRSMERKHGHRSPLTG